MPAGQQPHSSRPTDDPIASHEALTSVDIQANTGNAAQNDVDSTSPDTMATSSTSSTLTDAPSSSSETGWNPNRAPSPSSRERFETRIIEFASRFGLSPGEPLVGGNVCQFVENCNTGSVPRKVISHIFGRNKVCTRRIPERVWVCMCRKHYQRVRYRRGPQFSMTQANLVIQQALRMIIWSLKMESSNRVGVDPLRIRSWVLSIRKRELNRLAEMEEQDLVPHWLINSLGTDRTDEEIFNIVERLHREIEEGTLADFPPVEFLPQVADGGPVEALRMLSLGSGGDHKEESSSPLVPVKEEDVADGNRVDGRTALPFPSSIPPAPTGSAINATTSRFREPIDDTRNQQGDHGMITNNAYDSHSSIDNQSVAEIRGGRNTAPIHDHPGNSQRPSLPTINELAIDRTTQVSETITTQEPPSAPSRKRSSTDDNSRETERRTTSNRRGTTDPHTILPAPSPAFQRPSRFFPKDLASGHDAKATSAHEKGTSRITPRVAPNDPRLSLGFGTYPFVLLNSTNVCRSLYACSPPTSPQPRPTDGSESLDGQTPEKRPAGETGFRPNEVLETAWQLMGLGETIQARDSTAMFKEGSPELFIEDVATSVSQVVPTDGYHSPDPNPTQPPPSAWSETPVPLKAAEAYQPPDVNAAISTPRTYAEICRYPTVNPAQQLPHTPAESYCPQSYVGGYPVYSVPPLGTTPVEAYYPPGYNGDLTGSANYATHSAAYPPEYSGSYPIYPGQIATSTSANGYYPTSYNRYNESTMHQTKVQGPGSGSEATAGINGPQGSQRGSRGGSRGSGQKKNRRRINPENRARNVSRGNN
ncbi:hypothetical protein G7046_g8962 [Stylonectria norvegica]|nr:hypothetical protein G7046_g8962 [Stylonectria norvegica]